MCEVMTNKKGCNSLLIAELNTLWYVDFEFFFLSYYFLELMYFFFQDTYNNWLKERYEDDPSIYLDIDPDLWLKATDEVTDGTTSSLRYRELEKNYCKCNCYIFLLLFNIFLKQYV
jgi:hypothetical protein